MKLRFAPSASLSLLLTFAAVAAAQVPAGITPPPIRMGLWEAAVTIQSSAMGPGGAAGRTSVHRSCMTPDSWKETMQKMQSRQPNAECTTSNLQQDSHRVSFDGQCTVEQGMSVTYHVEMFLDSDTAMHGTSMAKMSGPMFPQGMQISSAISSKHISDDCGDLKPGESRPVHP